MDSSASVSARSRACLQALLAACACLVLAPPDTAAARLVRVYEVEIGGGADSPAALQEAMRQALVRATGRREAATDPALATIVAEAPRYVQSFRPLGTGTAQVVVFDGAALERAITAAGRSVWSPQRPFTLVTLSPPPTGQAAEAARRTIEQAAAQRGLPATLAPVALVDATGAELEREALLQSVQRLGGDLLLSGRGDAAGGGQWHWTLYSPFASESWSGPLESGIHRTVDLLTRVQGETLMLAEMDAMIEVIGVGTLADYATVTRLLEAVPGVRRVIPEEAAAGTVTYRVQVRGGAEAIDQALTGSARLTRAGAERARLVYQYRP